MVASGSTAGVDSKPRAFGVEAAKASIAVWLGLAAITMVGLVVRKYYLDINPGFPLADGGLFLVMIRDIQEAGYALPDFTSYNGGEIPFAYPPLTFYMAALAEDLFGIGQLELLRILPLAGSTLTILAMFWLAQGIFKDHVLSLTATLIFALAPRTFIWEIMGGGLTRSFGLLFAILAIAAGFRLLETRKNVYLLATALLAALAAMSHIQMIWFVTYSLGAIVLFQKDRVKSLGVLCAAGVGAAILAAPWWGAVIAKHGIDPFIAAAGTGNTLSFPSIASLFLFNFSSEPRFPIITALGLLGVIHLIGQKQYLFPVWLALILILDPRIGPTLAMLIMAMAGAIALHQVALPLLTSSAGQVTGRDVHGANPLQQAVFFAAVLIYGVFSALSINERSAEVYLRAVSLAERNAMTWIQENTDHSAKVVAVTGAAWWSDHSSEWLPALSERRVPSTVQGTEWLADNAFSERIRDYEELQACSVSNYRCLTRWSERNDVDFTHVFVSKKPFFALSPCCETLISSLRQAPGFEVAYENEEVVFFSKR